MKKLLAMALLATGLTVGCGDEDELSPGARDASGDTTTDTPVVPPKLDAAVPGVDAPVTDAATDAPATDSSVDSGGTADADTPDSADSVDSGEADAT